MACGSLRTNKQIRLLSGPGFPTVFNIDRDCDYCNDERDSMMIMILIGMILKIIGILIMIVIVIIAIMSVIVIMTVIMIVVLMI